MKELAVVKIRMVFPEDVTSILGRFWTIFDIGINHTFITHNDRSNKLLQFH